MRPTALKKMPVFTATVVLFSGFALFMYSLFATTVGFTGLVNHGLQGLGFICISLGMLGFLIIVVIQEARAASNDGTPFLQAVAAFMKEAGVLVLNIVCVGGPVFVFLGALTALDEANSISKQIFVITIMALCLAAAAGFLIWRHRHPRALSSVWHVLLVLFFAALTIAFFLAGVVIAGESERDLTTGPRTITCYQSDIERVKSTGRYRSITPDTFHFQFTDEAGRTTDLTIAEQDYEVGLSIIEAMENSADPPWIQLTYYEHSSLFVSAMVTHYERSDSSASAEAAADASGNAR